MSDKIKEKKYTKDYQKYLVFSALGFQMAFIIGALTSLGYYMDEWLSTQPIFLIILSLTSVFLAIYFMMKKVINMEQQYKKEQNNDC